MLAKALFGVSASDALGCADAAAVGAQTGFAVGGVAPVGHLKAPRAFFDLTLLKFDMIYAAAGTPHHIFPISSQKLLEISDAQISDFI